MRVVVGRYVEADRWCIWGDIKLKLANMVSMCGEDEKITNSELERYS